MPIREAGKKLVIPRCKNAFIPGVQDTERYKTRSAIERFFAGLKENKRLVARFKKLDSSFSNMHETSFDHMQKYAKSLPPLENAKQQQHLPIIPEANLTGTFD